MKAIDREIWRGSLFAWLSVGRNAWYSSDVTLAYEDSQGTPPFSREETDDTDDTDYTDDIDCTDDTNDTDVTDDTDGIDDTDDTG